MFVVKIGEEGRTGATWRQGGGGREGGGGGKGKRWPKQCTHI
jgi:hypothetical protein